MPALQSTKARSFKDIEEEEKKKKKAIEEIEKPVETQTGTTSTGQPLYNVQQGDKNYPTTLKGFQPDPNTTQLKFNPNGSVTISPKGSADSVTLSAEEYKQTLGDRKTIGQAPTQNLQKLSELQKGLETPLKQQLQTPIQEQAKQGELNLLNMGTADRLVEKATEVPAIQAVARGTAELVSNIGSVFGINLKKSTKAVQAEETFNTISSTIDAQIKSGDIAGAVKNIEVALDSIKTLQAQTRGKGKLNLRYWLDQGKDIETTAQKEIILLEAQRNQILRGGI